MRFFEFADAEAQLGLLRTIIDNTWSAIAKQAEEQKRVEAERKASAKLNPRRRMAGMGAPLEVPISKAPPPPPEPKVTNPQQIPLSNVQLPMAQQNLSQPYRTAASRLNNAPISAKSRTTDDDIRSKKNPGSGDDRHS